MKPLVGIALNATLEAAADDLLRNSTLTAEQRYTLTNDLEQAMLTPTSLRFMKGVKGDHINIVKLCQGSKLVFPRDTHSKVKKDQPKEYRRRREELIVKAEERRYKEMVFGVDGSQPGNVAIGKEVVAAYDQAAVGLNTIVSTLAAFGIAYYFAAYYSSDQTFCIVVGTGVATGVLILETVLFMARAARAT